MQMHNVMRVMLDEFEGIVSQMRKGYLNPHSKVGEHQSRFVRTVSTRETIRITLASLALKKDLRRNLNLSSSVCITMTLKFFFESDKAVCASTASIYDGLSE
jgi:hypothetical protein